MPGRSSDKRTAAAISAPDTVGTRHATPDSSPGFALWQVASIWQRAIRAALVSVDLTHAQFVLLASSAWLEMELGAEGTPVTQAHVAAHAKTDAVMTSEVLRTLERKELLRRRPHPTDARARQIELTPAGRRLARRAISLVEEADDAFFSAPGPELEALKRVLCGARP